MKVTSTEIKKALAGYEEKSYFITECKTCSTYFPDPQGLLKFDGLAIKKSYTKPCITGYEIKVSRGDFLQDNKWHLYLQYCNEFYFVVPNGLISKEEIPDNVGLIYYYPESGTLRKKKKALYREIEEPVGMYKYIIFSRLENERTPFYENRADYAKDYLEDKSEKRRLGKAFGSKLAKDLIKAQKRLEDLAGMEEKMNLFNQVMDILEKHNISFPNKHYWTNDKDYNDYCIKKLDEALQGKYPKDLYKVRNNLQAAIDRLDIIEEQYSGREVKND